MLSKTSGKTLGQHFLRDKNILYKIVKAAELKKEDTVLEIGAGSGILTEALAPQVRRLITVEIDTTFKPILEEKKKRFAQIELIFGDIRYILPSLVLPAGYKIVANIPYYLSAYLLRLIFEKVPKPYLIVLLVQKEVAKKICGEKGRFSLLSHLVSFYGKSRIISLVKRGAFYPVPKVDSAIIKIDDISDKNARLIHPADFWRVVKAGFVSPRKLLINNLSLKLGVSKENISGIMEKIKLPLNARAEQLTTTEWIKLARGLYEGGEK